MDRGRRSDVTQNNRGHPQDGRGTCRGLESATRKDVIAGSSFATNGLLTHLRTSASAAIVLRAPIARAITRPSQSPAARTGMLLNVGELSSAPGQPLFHADRAFYLT